MSLAEIGLLRPFASQRIVHRILGGVIFGGRLRAGISGVYAAMIDEQFCGGNAETLLRGPRLGL